jgi:hypothetical protein
MPDLPDTGPWRNAKVRPPRHGQIALLAGSLDIEGPRPVLLSLAWIDDPNKYAEASYRSNPSI